MSLTEKNIREKIFHNDLQSKPKGRFENIFYKALYNLTEDFFNKLKIFSKNAKILDYGCGTGSSLKKVIEFEPKKIVGIDISDVSIDKARSNIGSHKDNLELIVDNCEKTKFGENEFDLVYGTGILHHLQIDQCLNEISRVLKPGGRFLCLEFSKIQNSNLDFVYKNYSKIIPHIGQFIVGDKKPYEYLIKSIDEFINQEELIDLMKIHNFTKCNYRNFSGGIVSIHNGWKI